VVSEIIVGVAAELHSTESAYSFIIVSGVRILANRSLPEKYYLFIVFKAEMMTFSGAMYWGHSHPFHLRSYQLHQPSRYPTNRIISYLTCSNSAGDITESRN
jgi:hypothetical protein